jgi:biopolymer transport protein ExbD
MSNGTKPTRPLVSLVRASDGGSTVVRLKSKRIPLHNWNTAVVRNIGRSAHGEVYVEADASLPWADVVRALDALKGSEADVVLLTTTPTPDSNVSKLRRR